VAPVKPSTVQQKGKYFMKKRPTSITVIAWILIVSSVLTAITSTMSLNNPMVKELMSRSLLPLPVQYVIMYLGLIITVISGISILKGKNWSRYLYVIWSIIGFVIGITTSPMKAAMIPGGVIFLVIAFFLFRPKINEFFLPSELSNDSQGI
jgi:hypothetical protein